MANSFLKRIAVTCLIIFLTISAFWTRLDNFLKPNLRTIDENCYYLLAQQIRMDPFQYNSLPFAHYLTQIGHELPDYFWRPLFKHPPLFPVLISGSMEISGVHAVSAAVVSVFFGVLMIPLVYLLGRLIFNDAVGLISSLLLYMDPIQIMCSQKIWMETTLVFFMVAGVYLFARALNKDSNIYFLLSGFAMGCAALTKYPGLLSLLGVCLYAFIYRPDLFRRRSFRISLVIPFLMLLPWLIWNYAVYGINFFFEQLALHSLFLNHSYRARAILLLILFLLSFIGLVAAVRKKGQFNWPQRSMFFIKLILLLIFLFYFYRSIAHGLLLHHLPPTSWVHGLFDDAPHSFYFGKLMEYSFIYFLAFLSFIILKDRQNQGLVLIKINTMIILLFYTFWGNYQSRYILAAVPYLLVLGACVWLKSYQFFLRQPNFSLRLSGQVLMLILGALILLRTHIINTLISFTNNMCYF